MGRFRIRWDGDHMSMDGKSLILGIILGLIVGILAGIIIEYEYLII
jgi:hypothetical protein